MIEVLTPEQIVVLADQIKQLLVKDSQGVGEIPVVASLDNILSLPALQVVGNDEKVVEAPLSLLRGPIGLTPAISFVIEAIEYGEKPSVKKTGTDESPIITFLFPLAKNGDKLIPKKGLTGIEVKYESEPDSAYVQLWSFSDVMPDVSDFSPEGIAILQKPATDAAAEVRKEMVQLSEDVNQTREKLVEDAGKVNTDLTTAVGALEERAETVISETNTVKEAAEEAVINADNATTAANDAAGLANTAAKDTNKATELAVVAAKLAGEKAEQASTSADKADKAAGAADDAAALASEKATLANNAAGVADTATGKANTAIGNAETATKRANDAAAAAENIVSGIRPDWAVDDPTSENYIANKPDIPDWALEPEAPDSFPEAPKDNKTYGRKDGVWSEVNSAGNMDGGTAYSVYGGSLVMDGGNAND